MIDLAMAKNEDDNVDVFVVIFFYNIKNYSFKFFW